MYHKTSMSITGFAAVILLASPLAAVESTDRQEPSQPHRSEMQERGTEQRPVDSEQTHNQLRTSSEIVGMEIQSATGEKIGEADDLFIDMESGEIIAVVASTGGLPGTGAQRSLLSSEDVRFDGDKSHLKSNLTKEQLESAPRYREGETAGFDKVRRVGELEENSRQASNRNADSQHDSEGKPVQHEAKNLAATELVGMKIENGAGEEVGSVDRVYVDLEGGQVLGVVVSTGGFLGIGAHQNVLALNEFDYNAGEEKLSVEMTREQLRSAPVYKKDDSSWHAALRERSIRNAERNTSVRTSAETVSASAESGSDDLTVLNQGNSPEETKMTADIRSAIRDNDTMSSRANNVTIITQGNKVLLRGDVDSASEKTAVEGMARGLAGNENVTSELAVLSR